MKNVDKLRDDAINRVKCRMKLNAKLYEDGEYSYEELHYVQGQCMKEIEEIKQLAQDVKDGKIKEFIDHY